MHVPIPILALADTFLHQIVVNSCHLSPEITNWPVRSAPSGHCHFSTTTEGLLANDVSASVVLLCGFHPRRHIVFTVVCAKNGKETCAVKRSLFRGGLFLVHARNFSTDAGRDLGRVGLYGWRGDDPGNV